MSREDGATEIARLSQQMEDREKLWAANLDSLRTVSIREGVHCWPVVVMKA